LSHPDPAVNKLASDLMSDRYQLSKIHAKSIGEEIDAKDSRLLEENSLNFLVPRATTELKNAYILEKIKKIQHEMKTASPDDALVLIAELKQMQEIKKILSKELGERIILKF
jgi:DNA primase